MRGKLRGVHFDEESKSVHSWCVLRASPVTRRMRNLDERRRRAFGIGDQDLTSHRKLLRSKDRGV
jgi:hypothetical protein